MKSSSSLAVFLLLMPCLFGQTTNLPTGTSGSPLTAPPSYYQQLREIEKTQTDRIISEKVKSSLEAPDKERKARAAAQKMADLQLQELIQQKKLENLQKLEERQRIQQQKYYSYLKGLRQLSGQTNNAAATPKTESATSLQQPSTGSDVVPVQEAMKAEPPR
jgi:hypothetical protein